MNRKSSKIIAIILVVLTATAAFAGCSPNNTPSGLSDTNEPYAPGQPSHTDGPVGPTFTVTVWNGTAAEGFASGDGTENDPFVIMTAEQLAFLSDSVYHWNDYEGCYFRLGADIVLNYPENADNWETEAPANVWIPIGSDERKFCGNFNGDSHTVSGIYINNDSLHQGLFGYIENGTISNVGVIDSYIHAGSVVGAVVGMANACTVSNCYNAGTVIGVNEGFYYTCIGGVVGRNFKSTVSGCNNSGDVSGSGSANEVYIGGVVGANDSAEGGTSIVENCCNTGKVSGSTTGRHNSVCVGGVVGANDCRALNGVFCVKNCCNTGEVIGGSGTKVGGVVGLNYAGFVCSAEVIGCYNSGRLSGCGSYFGGIAGKNEAYSAVGRIAECYNIGDIIAEGKDYLNVGGIVGMNDGATVEKCYNIGSVSVTARGQDVGGIAGTNHAYGDTKVSVILNCYNIGSVTASGTAKDILVRTGGIVGYNYTEKGKTSVSCCYNCGTVAYTGEETVPHIGGVIGAVTRISGSDEISSCYYLDSCITGSAGSGGTALGAEQMKQQASYSGFDFGEIWTIGAEAGYDYPTLR